MYDTVATLGVQDGNIGNHSSPACYRSMACAFGNTRTSEVPSEINLVLQYIHACVHIYVYMCVWLCVRIVYTYIHNVGI